GPGSEQRLPVPRPPASGPVERFSAPPAAHTVGLSSDRAAAIVRQSSNARWVAFLAILVVVVFVILYYFYDLGFPGISGSSRLTKEVGAQQVASVERGYKLFEANCARCLGAQGQGGIGPVLDDQAKLLTHLTPAYIKNVLTAGGRYVCGNANSLMPVWADTNGGPLNYQQVNDLVAWIRATSDVSFEATDPTTGKTTTVHGWRDPTYAQPAGATPFPACWTDAFKNASSSPAASGSAAASGSPAAGASPQASGGTSAPATTLSLTAANTAYDKTTLEAPAGQPFAIQFTNNDAGIPHNVSIHKDSPTGAEVWRGEIFPGVGSRTYQVPALPAGTYGFVCSVHSNMTGTLTVK
ncbi:MAG: cupredoxin domain-containing protein, partial [Candidatus Limnocylindrales bacterium]